MPISPEEMDSGRSAFKRIKVYDSDRKKRYWSYFSGAFWTFQICVIGLIGTSSRVRYVLPALWLLLLCFIICQAVNRSVRYDKDVKLLENLYRKFGTNVNFESLDSPSKADANSQREKWGGFYPLFAFCVLLAAVFGMSYLIHHLLPSTVPQGR